MPLRRSRRAAVAGAALALALSATASTAAASSAGHSPIDWTVDQASTYMITPEVGPTSINRTDLKWDVYGADLGHMFTYHGKIYMTFGDTFGGPAAADFWSVPHGDWRSNTMAYTSDHNPRDGLKFDGMISDTPGHAKELLSSKKVAGDEQTVIPTYGVSVGNRMYLHYMSVKEFGAPGHWTLNYSGIAYSDDGGQNWVKNSGLTWPGDSNFGQVAFVRTGRYVYLFGIPGGRYGGVQLARVPKDEVLTASAYRYWTGSAWSSDISAAQTIVPPNVGELSVQWNSYYHAWLMMYLDDPDGLIQLRMAPSLTGPWGDAKTVVTSTSYPSLYAPYITPKWNDGPDIYFTMSQFGPYFVELMHTKLVPAK